MTTEGVDYAWARPNPACLYVEGKRFASRYLSYDTTGKNLTRAEAEQLAAAGIAIVCNWEWQTGDAKGGFVAGQRYGAAAVAQAAACGMPDDRPIYFSVDYDPAGVYGSIAAYFLGIATNLPVSRIGAYGGLGTIRYLFDNHLITWGWQTYAWSHGVWDPRAHVRQYLNGVTMCGSGDGGLDLDLAMTDDYGQWGVADMTPDQAYVQHVMNYRIEGIVSMRDPIVVPSYDEQHGGFTEPNMLAQAIRAIPTVGGGAHTHPAVVTIGTATPPPTHPTEAS